jgi:hypothetical protein
MEIKLLPVTVQEKETLSNMYQFYYYDFSRYTNQDLNDDGTYGVNIDFYWEGDPRWNPWDFTLEDDLDGKLKNETYSDFYEVL